MSSKTTLILLATLAAGAVQAGEFPLKMRDVDRQMISSVPLDGIPAMTNPVIVDAEDATYRSPSDVGTPAYVEDGDRVLGVELDGRARAYPLNLGWWHEVINDRLGDRFVSVTYCPLTGTGLVFDATDEDGSQFELGVSGWLLNSNLVLYDRRDDRSLYPQMTFIGLVGEYRDVQLTLLPVVETTWGLWKEMYPDTDVPLYGTGLERYTERRQRIYSEQTERYYESLGGYPYDTYREDDNVYFPITTSQPDTSVYRLKDVVLGLCLDGETKAYPYRDLPDVAVVNDRLGERC